MTDDPNVDRAERGHTLTKEAIERLADEAEPARLRYTAERKAGWPAWDELSWQTKDAWVRMVREGKEKT